MLYFSLYPEEIDKLIAFFFIDMTHLENPLRIKNLDCQLLQKYHQCMNKTWPYEIRLSLVAAPHHVSRQSTCTLRQLHQEKHGCIIG
jgi:hypothetical protein